ncbi:MAG TPA: hypothetical protein VEA80_01160 [Vitreimonas sp.]|uniref:hypothetical protein n=1 Tax=Vitreimonas sp. TaxID=3069702 RepID=UPI002D5238D4|nr:hypothetical protein [Vitreimonas sp.]HYD86060.1 hypothetical protein [Vitreimonas sp.]
MSAVSMSVSYFPKPGHEDALLRLVLAHYPALYAAGLATERPPQIWRAVDKRTGAAYFIEMFEWVSQEASDIAHRTPEVMALWEPMGAHLDTMTLAQVEAIEPRLA